MTFRIFQWNACLTNITCIILEFALWVPNHKITHFCSILNKVRCLEVSCSMKPFMQCAINFQNTLASYMKPICRPFGRLIHLNFFLSSKNWNCKTFYHNRNSYIYTPPVSIKVLKRKGPLIWWLLDELGLFYSSHLSFMCVPANIKTDWQHINMLHCGFAVGCVYTCTLVRVLQSDMVGIVWWCLAQLTMLWWTKVPCHLAQLNLVWCHWAHPIIW